jgi:hypothetical protein
VNDLARVQETDEELLDAVEGRHAIDEDALVTPIFAALRRGIRRRSHEPARESLRDPVDEFHRDPLTAPIPVQALVPAPSRSHERIHTAAHGYGEARARPGRHHREPVSAY